MTDTPEGATGPGPAAERGTHRTLVILLGVIAALVVVAIVVVLTRGGPAALDRTSPEGVVQEYAAAVLEGRFDEARNYLSIEPRENCRPFDPSPHQQLRVALRNVSIAGDRAFVHVLITTSDSSDPFGGGGYQDSDSFELRREGEAWLIRSAPWQFTICHFAEQD